MALSYDSIVTLPPRSVRPDGTKTGPIPSWSPISATLILGDRSAVLVDCPPTVERASEVAAWIEASARQLVAMYATHGHGDHFIGFTEVSRRFPDARLLGTPKTVAYAREQASPPTIDERWRAAFPGQLPEDIRLLEPVDGTSLDLEGHEIRFVAAGFTDTHDTTFVHVPDLGLVVAGDIAYNEVHLHTAETDHQRRGEWIAAIDAISALDPSAVVAGHKKPGNDNDPRHLDETKGYLRDTDELLHVARSPDEFVDLMMQRYLAWVNPNILWSSARALVTA
ncbi:MBL fold metallo-hydrolase [Micromonospora sp. NPDC093277]|uniref:MBL fold metallo-hydrolase n=1 Tax=Micromonospora sp. NPDC093277 TaxID=3364291 RepID=UPI00381D1457